MQLDLMDVFGDGPLAGSFNAGVAVHLFARGLVHGRYTAFQGRKVGADGRIDCAIDGDGTVWIGGRVETIAARAELRELGRNQ